MNSLVPSSGSTRKKRPPEMSGTLSCWTSIYDIKTKTALQGQLVGVQNAIVTSLVYSGAAGARKAQGYFVQIKSGDDGYVDENNSGVFVFGTVPANLVVGSRIDLNPTQVTIKDPGGRPQYLTEMEPIHELG